MSLIPNNGYENDRLSQDSEYQGAATGRDEPDIFDDDDIVEIYLRLKSESESDFSDFTDEEEENKQVNELQENQGQSSKKDNGEDEWLIEGEEDNNSNSDVPEESEHELQTKLNCFLPYCLRLIFFHLISFIILFFNNFFKINYPNKQMYIEK